METAIIKQIQESAKPTDHIPSVQLKLEIINAQLS